MSRRVVANLFLAILIGLAAVLVWALLYELVVALRFKPSLAGEGLHRWDLLLAQSADRSWHTFFIPFRHFYDRLIFEPTRLETFIRGAIALGLTVFSGLALWIAARMNRPPTHYGAAKFGNILDAEKARLIAPKGLIVGKLGQTILRSDDPAHVLVVGPTRSGKGVSFVIPNGLSWLGSSIWFDPKGENYAAFARQRAAMGDKVFVFSPGNSNTHRYNPLDFIRQDERMPTDCLVVSSFLIPDDGKEIWGRSARILLQAMIGYAVASPAAKETRTLETVASLTKSGVDFNSVLKGIVATQREVLPQWVIDGFNQFIALEKETRNSALFNVTTALAPWNSRLICAATEKTDFNIRNLRREPMAIFVSASVAELEIFRPIVKLLIQQIHDQLMMNLPGKDEPLKVLIMIDEFRQLGRMDDLVSKLTINAGYGFRMCLILQDLGQLDELYGRPTRITTVSACQVKLFIRINDAETSEYVSEMLGNRTEQLVTPLIRGGQKTFQRRDKNVQYIETALRSPQELREMAETQSILLVPNAPGFELKKIRYYADRPWKELAVASKGKPPAVPRLITERGQKKQGFENIANAAADAETSGANAESVAETTRNDSAESTKPAAMSQPSSVDGPVVPQSVPSPAVKSEPVFLKKSPVKGFKKNSQALDPKDSVSVNSLIRASREASSQDLSALTKGRHNKADAAVLEDIADSMQEEAVVFDAAETN